MAETRGQRLRKARSRFFKSARAAASAMGIPPATYGAHERAEAPGGRDYGPTEAEKYGRRFKVAPEWLLTSRGRGPGPQPPEAAFEAEQPDETAPPTVKLVGYVGAGDAAHFYAVAQGELDDVPAPEGATPETVAVEIRGKSLGELFEHWLVFYDSVRRPVTSDLIGRLCVVGLSDDRVLVKKIRRGHDGLYDLYSNTEDPIKGVTVEWAARVKIMVPR